MATERRFGEGVLSLERGDITRVHADAIVNAANSRLAPGGGVCGAIHGAGGPSIAVECRVHADEHGLVAPGGVAVTGAGRLSARHVIHAVGPVWHGGASGEADVLASAYRHSVQAADDLGLTSIAFPSISTGIYGYPVGKAAPVALAAVADALRGARTLREVRFVLFDAVTYAAYESALDAL